MDFRIQVLHHLVFRRRDFGQALLRLFTEAVESGFFSLEVLGGDVFVMLERVLKLLDAGLVVVDRALHVRDDAHVGGDGYVRGRELSSRRQRQMFIRDRYGQAIPAKYPDRRFWQTILTEDSG